MISRRFYLLLLIIILIFFCYEKFVILNGNNGPSDRDTEFDEEIYKFTSIESCYGMVEKDMKG